MRTIRFPLATGFLAVAALLFHIAVLCLTPACTAAKDKSAEAGSEQKVAQIEKLLDKPLETTVFRENMSLSKFLQTLESLFPKDHKVTLRLDEQALGKDLPKVAQTQIKLTPFSNVSFRTVLRQALDEASREVELDYLIRPTGIVITRPPLAAYVKVYEVRSIIDEAPSLVQGLGKANSQDPIPSFSQKDGPGWLVSSIMASTDMRAWESIEVVNGIRLLVRASATRQEQIVDLLEALRRLQDQAVVMNAHLYEVDRAFFKAHVAPLFARTKDSQKRPAVVRIAGPLFKRMRQQKLVQEGDNVKIRPNQEATFLSRHSVFRFTADPLPANAKDKPTDTGMTGISFRVRPHISADRRYLRLKIVRNVAQLVRIDKTKTLDAASGNQIEVEAPNLRKTSVTETIDIPDTTPILMPADYQPAGKESEGKVWLLMARPFIWIEEEARLRGGDFSPKSVWDSDVEEEGTTAPGVRRLPSNTQVKEILQAVITDVLTNPDLKDTRDFYGTAEDKTLSLADSETLGWPKQFRPEIHGYHLVPVPDNPFAYPRRVLGVCVNEFNLKQKKTGLLSAPIAVCLFNAGGSANGGVIGGCTVYYVPKRVGKHWTVEYTGYVDP